MSVSSVYHCDGCGKAVENWKDHDSWFHSEQVTIHYAQSGRGVTGTFLHFLDICSPACFKRWAERKLS